ncbi:MAG TPA: flagellar hook capping FlgD N-terminal domain-containing protein [Opitutaceae bacterium]|nr:flagellar hook capping FlgD N-terminal domain-containing protein [Opitutaceae bacterium]
MSTVSGVSSGSSDPTNSTTSATTATLPQQALGEDDFLKLLAQQFQSQDPLKPMDDTSFISQMAQFTSLQQTSDMSKNITSLLSNQQQATANSYLGHRVTVDTGNGTTDTGDVTEVDLSGSAPQLMVNGTGYPLTAVLSVQPGAIATNPSTTTPTTTTTP